MIVLRQKMIYREDLKANPDVLYIFGDNAEHKGFGGQAAEMRGEPNAFGIVTKRRASHHYPVDYYMDGPEIMEILMRDFQKLTRLLEKGIYQAVVIPLDGIGTGLARMPQNAPHALAFINEEFTMLKFIWENKK